MAKTIEEICKDLREWQEENPKERGVLLIAALEDRNIMAAVRRPKQKVINNIASALVKNMHVAEAISHAFKIALEYTNEKEEDN